MALPTTGKISLGDVRTELGTTGAISLGSEDVRTLAGKTSGTVKMSDLYGKTNALWEGRITVGKYTGSSRNESYGYLNAAGESFGKINPNKIQNEIISEFYAEINDSVSALPYYAIRIGFVDASGVFKFPYLSITAKVNDQILKFDTWFIDYYCETSLEMLNYFKSNIGKTIPIYITEATPR